MRIRLHKESPQKKFSNRKRDIEKRAPKTMMDSWDWWHCKINGNQKLEAKRIAIDKNGKKY